MSFSTKADRIGTKSCRLEVEPFEGEINFENNSAQLEVEVTADKIRVLLADNFPLRMHDA